MAVPGFKVLASAPAPPLDHLALAMAGELGPVDADSALGHLDELGGEVAMERTGSGDPADDVAALVLVLGERHGFRGNAHEYDAPENSLLDRVLERRRGLPILLSVVWIAVAERAGITLAGIGLPGHYVVGHLGARPPLLADPFAGGAPVPDAPSAHARPWGPHETALRMLNNLVAAYGRRGDLGRQLRVAELRLLLPLAEALRAELEGELARLRARLN